MKRRSLPILSFLLFVLSAVADADPIHAIADGAYWHHDSGWVFAQKIGEFELVGIPQDIAGSRDAAAYYARTAGGIRTVASVDVYPEDSAAAGAMLSSDLQRQSEDSLVIGLRDAPRATRVVYAAPSGGALTVLYHVAAHDWHVRILVTAPDATSLPVLDAFVRGQRWDTLART